MKLKRGRFFSVVAIVLFVAVAIFLIRWRNLSNRKLRIRGNLYQISIVLTAYDLEYGQFPNQLDTIELIKQLNLPGTELELMLQGFHYTYWKELYVIYVYPLGDGASKEKVWFFYPLDDDTAFICILGSVYEGVMTEEMKRMKRIRE